MNEQYNIEVGCRIKESRKKKNISMARLGELVGLHESTIQRYEQGKIKALDIEKISDFASALSVSPAYLMGWAREEDVNFSKNLNFLMRRFNETANGLSLKTHINPLRIRELINGYDNPTTKELKVLAQHYKISNTDLLTNTLYLSDISYIESDKFNETMNLMMELNDDGIEKVNEYISDLSDKYRKR